MWYDTSVKNDKIILEKYHMQQLTLEQIKQITFGVASVKEAHDKIVFNRFTEAQQDIYKKVSSDFYMKSFSTSGVSLEFYTNSEYLGLSVAISPGSSRRFFAHSIFVNGSRIDELSGKIEAGTNDTLFCKQFQLGAGDKKVRIAFPWSVSSKLVSLELDDGAFVSPVTKNLKMLMFGDSITQGYDASKPENAYAVKLVEYLNADARNKGIGGECFCAELAHLKEDIRPDVITVAYGTNDWGKRTKEEFERECKGFFTNLRKNYPYARIFAFAPIWRADINEEKTIGEPLGYISQYINSVAKELENITVIDCADFVPHSLEYYQTDGLHPIDAGFASYVENLWNTMQL